MPVGTPLVTVLTTVRDGELFLPRTIDSVRAQTLDDWELVIVDDASTDRTPALLTEAAAMDPRIRILTRTTSGGPYVAANDGLREASGRYVARLDADDLAVPERLARQVEFVESDPALRAAASDWIEIDGDDRAIGGPISVPSRSSSVLRWRLCVAGGLVHSTALVRRDAFEAIGGYAEVAVTADYRLWCQLARRGWLGVVPEPLVRWRRHEGQISAARLEQQMSVGAVLLGEHIREMTGESWGPDDLRALLTIGRFLEVDGPRGIDVLDRWERLWRADPVLTASERRELSRFGLRVRLGHLRRNRRGSITLPVTGFARWIKVRLESARRRLRHPASRDDAESTGE